MARALTDPAARTDRPRLCLFWRHVRAGGRDRFGGGGGLLIDPSAARWLGRLFWLWMLFVRPAEVAVGFVWGLDSVGAWE